jgi:hypothetical protein
MNEVCAREPRSVDRGASRGAKNFGNQPPLTTGREPSHPRRVAQWQQVTVNGDERRATYKQEVGSSNLPPPMQDSALLLHLPIGALGRTLAHSCHQAKDLPAGNAITPTGRKPIQHHNQS